MRFRFSQASPVLPAWLAGLLAVVLAGNVLGWWSLGLLLDEAYYWVWSQRLEWGYYDHPPLVAWLIRLTTDVFGDGAWAVRLPAVLSWAAGAAFGYDLARRLYQDRTAGWLAVLIWSTLPIVQVGFHIVTPDSALVLASWGVYYFATRALTDPQPGFWLGAGVCAGLALLGKYPAVLVLGGVFLALLLTRQGRAVLATRWPWLGAGVALCLFLPVVYWNYRHDWVSFLFQFRHGVGEEVARDPLPQLVAFLAGQMAVTMPWTWLAMVWASVAGGPWRRQLPGHASALLVAGFWVPLLVFGVAGLTADSGPNWPVTAYIPGTLLLAGALRDWLYRDGAFRRGWQRWREAAVVAAALAAILFIDLMRFPGWMQWLEPQQLPAARTQLTQSYGWEQVEPELRGLLRQQEARHPAGARCGVLLDNHATAGMVAWRLRDPLRVGVTMQTRISQYHLWQQEQPVPAGHWCLYVEKFDLKGRRGTVTIPERVQLPEGNWRRVSVLELDNPDHTRRWFAFYVPEDVRELRKE